MKGVRFYEEFENKRKGVSEGNVVAAFVCNGFVRSRDDLAFDGLVGLYNWPDSAVASSIVTLGYLRDKCKRIPESKARAIHPSLFERLDAEE